MNTSDFVYVNNDFRLADITLRVKVKIFKYVYIAGSAIIFRCKWFKLITTVKSEFFARVYFRETSHM